MYFTRVIFHSDLSDSRHSKHLIVIEDASIITDSGTLSLGFIRTLKLRVPVIVPGLLVDSGHPVLEQELPELRDLGYLLEPLEVLA